MNVHDENLLRGMLEAAAETGAKKALQRIGLDDEKATNDMRELRSLVETFRQMKRDVVATITKAFTTLFLAALALGALVLAKQHLITR